MVSTSTSARGTPGGRKLVCSWSRCSRENPCFSPAPSNDRRSPIACTPLWLASVSGSGAESPSCCITSGDESRGQEGQRCLLTLTILGDRGGVPRAGDMLPWVGGGLQVGRLACRVTSCERGESWRGDAGGDRLGLVDRLRAKGPWDMKGF